MENNNQQHPHHNFNPTTHHQQREYILSLLNQCQSQNRRRSLSQSHDGIQEEAPSEGSPKPLDSTSPRLLSNRRDPRTPTPDRFNLNGNLRKIHRELLKLSSSHSALRGVTYETRGESQQLQSFLYKVARELIYLDRVVASIDDEINGKDILNEYYELGGFGCDFGTGEGDDTDVNAIDHDNCEDAPRVTSCGNIDCDNSNKTLNESDEIDENAIINATTYDDAGDGDPEQWIDRCLDICGYAISLEVAVDCLRDVVATTKTPHLRHDLHQQTNQYSSTIHTRSEFAVGGNRSAVEPPGLPAVISSLRTIRRRLLPLPSSSSYRSAFSAGPQTVFPILFLNGFPAIQNISNQFNAFTNLQKFVILPLEYFHFHRTQHSRDDVMTVYSSDASASSSFVLSDSLVDLATSVLPTLVSAACHAMDLPLPLWASPKKSLSYLLHCAWRGVVASEMWKSTGKSTIKTGSPHESRDMSATLETISTSTTEYFQALMRRLIHLGYVDLVVRRLYDIWMMSRSSGGDATLSFENLCVKSSMNITSTTARSTTNASLESTQSTLCIQLKSALFSMTSEREVANVVRKMALYAAKQILATATTGQSYPSSSHQNEVLASYIDHVLQFLESLLLPSLVNSSELREAILNFVVLSPPSSFFQPQSSQFSFQTLHILDKIVPVCVARLLASACSANKDYIESQGGVKKYGSSLDESDDDQDSTNSLESKLDRTGGFLTLVIMVASVWSEEVFITRTDAMQQQYATEFLLQSLKGGVLEQNDIGHEHSGRSLASTLVQGITLRLEVSRAESIRIDGMRIAEAMSSIIGQPIRFDELHPSDEGQEQVEGDRAKYGVVQKNSERKRTKTNKHRTKKAPVTLDPDAEYVSDPEESSDSGDVSSYGDSLESDGKSSCSSNSSWGEDSLEPYVMDDDEEDLRRVRRPRSLRECFAYLIENENETLAYDKHEAALMELPAMVSSRPLDLVDMTPTLVRILLHMEDKFNMENFVQMKMDSLMAIAVHAPFETCLHLVNEIGQNVSLGTRLEALTVLGGMAQELSGLNKLRNRQELQSKQRESHLLNNVDEIAISSKLQRSLNLYNSPNVSSRSNHLEESLQSTSNVSKTRRWRRPRTTAITVTNRFGPIAAQVMYNLFAFISRTKSEESIWGGPLGEKFLSEFLRTLSIMLDCSRTYPGNFVHVLAQDLFELAWSFHDAQSSEVRYAVLAAMGTSISLVPVEFMLRLGHFSGESDICSEWIPYLEKCCCSDPDSNCRALALMIIGTIAENNCDKISM